jgi:hypothetical protein
MRYPTWTELITLLAICVILYGLMLPASHEMRERELRNMAKNWQPFIETEVADQNLLGADVDLRGMWSRGSSRAGSEIEITPTDDPTIFRVRYWSGSGGGCEWKTTAKRKGSLLTLADPVADIRDGAFKSFRIVQVGERDCLVPAPSVAKFNAEVASTEDWHYNILKRGPR